jgi:hypothetical protein
MRNVILLVEAWRDEDGSPLVYSGTQTVDELGGIGDPNQGYYAGLPGKLYAKVLEDPNAKSPVMFTEAAAITSDNRIAAFATDTTQYSFTAPAEGDLVHVRAHLIYRRTFPVFRDAKGWTLDGHGEPLKDLTPPDFGHLMEEAVEDVVVGPGGGLSKDDQKCVNAINKGAAKVAKAQGGDNSSCIKNAGKAKLPPGQTIEECIVSDPKGKVAKAISKIQTDKCPSPPAFPDLVSTTSKQVIGDLMVAKELALVHAIFGTDLDSGVIVNCDADKPGCGCQAAVIKAAQKCQDTKLKEFGSCKKNALKEGKAPLPGGALSAGELQDACMGTGSGSIPDPKSKISGKCADFSTGKKCGGLDLATYFPGAPSVGEIDVAIECEVCNALNALDGLSRLCDSFDDGVLNGSCPGCGNEVVEPGIGEACDPPESACGEGGVCSSDCTSCDVFQPITVPTNAESFCKGFDPNGNPYPDRDDPSAVTCSDTGGHSDCPPGPTIGDPNSSARCIATSGAAMNTALGTPAITFPLDGDFTLDCGPVDPNTGEAVCSCEIEGLLPATLPGIGFVCLNFVPTEDCTPGRIDCDGGSGRDVTTITDHSVGADVMLLDPNFTLPFCGYLDPNDANPECDRMCDTYCASLEPAGSYRTILAACEGFCQGGDREDLPCDTDVDCPFSSCAGGEGVPHEYHCGCDCLQVGGDPSRAGALNCEVGVQISVENAAPCNEGEITIYLLPKCIPVSSEFGTGIILDANLNYGTSVGGRELFGVQGKCSDVANGVLTGLTLVGSGHAMDSNIGDLQVDIELVMP